jgi:hypothetical protein
LPVKTEHIRISRTRDAAVYRRGQRDRLRSVGAIVGLGLGGAGERFEHDAGGIRELGVAAHRDVEGAGFLPSGVERELVGREIPAGEFEVGALAATGAERINAGDEGQLADGDAVDEVFATAVNRVFDFDGVSAVGGNVETQDRIGAVAVVVGVGEFAAAFVVERERRLEPAGHGVGEVGDERAGVGDHDDALALFRGETEAVDFARHDLTVHDGGNGDFHFRLGARAAGIGVGILACSGVGRRRGDAHGFAHLGELADDEHHWIRKPTGRAEADLAFAGGGVGIERDFEGNGFREDRAHLTIAARGEQGAHFGGALFVLGGEGRFGFVGAGGSAFVLELLLLFAEVVDLFL